MSVMSVISGPWVNAISVNGVGADSYDALYKLQMDMER